MNQQTLPMSSANPHSQASAQRPHAVRWFTENCLLRHVNPNDVQALWSAVMDPTERPYSSVPVPNSRDEVLRMVTTAQTQSQRGNAVPLVALRKQTKSFVAWINARATRDPREWLLDWFTPPRRLEDGLAPEALNGAAHVMFEVLSARTLFAYCPPEPEYLDMLLSPVGFVQNAPAGSPDATGRPRAQTLYLVHRLRWLQLRDTAQLPNPVTKPLVGVSIS